MELCALDWYSVVEVRFNFLRDKLNQPAMSSYALLACPQSGARLQRTSSPMHQTWRSLRRKLNQCLQIIYRTIALNHKGVLCILIVFKPCTAIVVV